MNKSESIKNLAIALAKFQAEVKNPPNTANNPFFKSKYAPLSEVLNTVRPILSKHGLSVVQAPSTEENNIVITTILIHESGEFIEPEPLKLKMDKVTAQGAGSAITYASRYALSAILGISSEDDDDANSIEPSSNKKTNTKQCSKPKTDDVKQDIVDNSLASDKQLKYLYVLTKEKGFEDMMSSYIKKTYNKDSSKALTKAEASEIIKMLQEIGK